jgi:hypothetical protein
MDLMGKIVQLYIRHFKLVRMYLTGKIVQLYIRHLKLEWI